jgi:hypothetical protein
MGFADAYLLKAGLREPIIQTDPHSDLKIMVAVPVTNESGLEKCLDSLFMAAAPIRTEVLILVNAAASAPPAVFKQNLSTLSRAREWIAAHHHPWMDFHIWLDHSFGKKEAGVGMARKILMDEAVRRLSIAGNPRPGDPRLHGCRCAGGPQLPPGVGLPLFKGQQRRTGWLLHLF